MQLRNDSNTACTPRAKAAPRPKPLRVKPENIPARLRRLPQWIGWDFERDERGAWTKVPKALAGYRASSTDPRDWSSFDAVLAAHQSGLGSGIGYITTPADGFALVDFDHVVDPMTGRIELWAGRIVQAAQRERRTYCEISVSRTGLHLFLPSRRVFDGIKRPVGEGQAIEIYSFGRFFTVSGWRVQL